jgi:colanic acid/amylovoran/stewartan biosynthesis glycosyltransferase WcaL/AmsK/CpsK
VKPVVLHLVETFLGRSEIFIYNCVASHVAWDAVVLCKFTDNEKEFPAKRRLVLPAPTTKRDPAWWLNETVMKFTGRSLWHRRVEKALRDVKPSLIHAHFGQMGYLILPVKRRLGIPLVTSFYGYDMSVLPRRPGWSARLAQLFREGDLFLVEGAFMKQRLIELGAPADKVRVQRIGIHVDRYPAWHPKQSEIPVVLFVGRFTEKKGLLAALQAVGVVLRRGQSLRFKIIGDGDQRQDMQRYVAENKLTECVEFLGMQPHAQVIQELHRAHVFIHPSRTASNGDTEGGAPTILLEAQAVGVPIVTTRHADIPNVVRAGNGIFLSDETNAAELAENLYQALHSSEGCDQSFVRQHHNVAKEVLNLEECYGQLARS